MRAAARGSAAASLARRSPRGCRRPPAGGRSMPPRRARGSLCSRRDEPRGARGASSPPPPAITKPSSSCRARSMRIPAASPTPPPPTARAARDHETIVIVQSEIDAYPGRVRDLTLADGLPRISVSLHRLVVVPRLLVNAATYAAISRRLKSTHAFASLEYRDELRDLFATTLVDQLDRAIAATTPSPKRPLAVGRDWVSVGVDGAFVWRLPLLNEPAWDGHHYVLELTRDPVTRRVRNAVGTALAQIDASLAMLSRIERNDILRRAAHGH